MATAVKTKPRAGSILSDEEFEAFVAGRPHGERWQLIDGEAVMMTPPRLRHQRIAGNLAMRLNVHFETQSKPLYAFHEVGLMVPGVKRFRPTADLAVVPDAVDPATIWADRFLLAGEVLSDSNTAKQIERKRRNYMQHPDNLYVLIMAQEKPSIEIWARRKDWKPFELTDLDDTLELPELGFSTTLRRIYAGTSAAPPLNQSPP